MLASPANVGVTPKVELQLPPEGAGALVGSSWAGGVAARPKPASVGGSESFVAAGGSRVGAAIAEVRVAVVGFAVTVGMGEAVGGTGVAVLVSCGVGVVGIGIGVTVGRTGDAVGALVRSTGVTVGTGCNVSVAVTSIGVGITTAVGVSVAVFSARRTLTERGIVSTPILDTTFMTPL